MWDDLRGKWAVERQQLRRLLEHYRPLIQKCASNPPDDIELSALAAMLHIKRILSSTEATRFGVRHSHLSALTTIGRRHRRRAARGGIPVYSKQRGVCIECHHMQVELHMVQR